MEDQPVADRAVKTCESKSNVKVKVIKNWESLCKSKCPKSSSYETPVLHYKDLLMITKFLFFPMLQDFSKVI